MRILNPNSFLLPNATSRDFHPQCTKDLPRPAALEGNRDLIVGYLGTLDWRFDPNFVFEAAEALPDVTFAIVGHVNPDQHAGLAGLRRLPNILMPGEVGYDEGRAWVAAFDVGIIPFKLDETNDAINSVKMYMYLMAGLPVVSTAIEESRRNPFVRTATTPVEFVQVIEQVARSLPVSDRLERIEYALGNTWEVRAKDAITLLQRNGLCPS